MSENGSLPILSSDTMQVGEPQLQKTASSLTRRPRPLTEREENVARKLIDGGTLETIAEELGTLPNNIKSAKTGVFSKLGLKFDQSLTPEAIDSYVAANPRSTSVQNASAGEGKREKKTGNHRKPKQSSLFYALNSRSPLVPHGSRRYSEVFPREQESQASSQIEVRLSPHHATLVKSYVRMGFSLIDIGKEARDVGIPVESAIAYVGVLARNRGLADQPLIKLQRVLEIEKQKDTLAKVARRSLQRLSI